jgi:hypothetical protein
MAAYYRCRRAAMTPEQIEAERARLRVENPKRLRGLDEPYALGLDLGRRKHPVQLDRLYRPGAQLVPDDADAAVLDRPIRRARARAASGGAAG